MFSVSLDSVGQQYICSFLRNHDNFKRLLPKYLVIQSNIQNNLYFLLKVFNKRLCSDDILRK